MDVTQRHSTIFTLTGFHFSIRGVDIDCAVTIWHLYSYYIIRPLEGCGRDVGSIATTKFAHLTNDLRGQIMRNQIYLDLDPCSIKIYGNL